MNKSKLINILRDRFANRSAKVGVVGMGYVGVPLALGVIDAGFEVLGYDTDLQKVQKLNRGKSCFAHIKSKRLSKYVKGDKLTITAAPDNLSVCDVILICVPTPISINREPDLSYVESACQDIAGILRRGQLIILESSTYPGTTAELVAQMLDDNPNDYKLGEDYFLGYSPEREDPGNKKYSVRNTPKVVSGITPDSLQLVKEFYDKIVEQTVSVSSTDAAEMVKILENTYRAVNIALVNELKCVCERLNLDIWEVIAAAATKPYGYQAFYPSAGVGGECIAVDPFYLSWKARQVETPTKFIDLANEINWEMPRYVVRKIQQGLNKQGKSIKNSKILVLGVAYKKNVSDTRESAALKVIANLINLEGNISYCDPLVPVIGVRLLDRSQIEMQTVVLSEELVREHDCIVLITDHDCFNYQMIFANAVLLVDTHHRFGIVSQKVIQA
jgi:UDP-N-acetyl-D-glucosamine dehydrogenase